MPFVSKTRSFFRNLFLRRRIDIDLDREIQDHLEMLFDENIRNGLPPEEARRAAWIELGGVEQVKEQVREVRIGYWMQSVIADCRFGLRQLRKNPVFSVVAILTLAIVIGANTLVFSVLNSLVLRPLNVPLSESLYAIQRATDYSGRQSYPGYVEIRDRNRSFEDLAALIPLHVGLNSGENPTGVRLQAVSGNYFDVLAIQPHLGRFFHTDDEDGPNSAPYLVISHNWWQSRFQADKNIIGRTVLLNKNPFTIIGVAPPDFHGTILFLPCDSFIPMVNREQIDGQEILNAHGIRSIFQIIGHLKDGVTQEQAAADLNAIGADLERRYPKEYDQMRFSLARPGLLGDYMGRPVRAFLTAMMLLAALILLAGCANLGNLFAARASDRSREIGMRLALGATRFRVLRQLFTESLLVSMIGGAVGSCTSILLLRWLSAWEPFAQVPGLRFNVNADAYVHAVALLLAIASGFLFGVAAVRQGLLTDPYEIVKSGSQSNMQRRIIGRDLLVVVQITICVLLITCSIVALRGWMRSLDSDLGFDPEHAMLINPGLHLGGYRGATAAYMQKRVIEAVENIPGVSSVGIVDSIPLTTATQFGSKAVMVFKERTIDLRPANAAASAIHFRISPDYFRAAATRLVAGRAFHWQDDANATRVAVINKTFARKVFGSVDDALEEHFKMGDGALVQVVGVVEDGKYTSLTEEPECALFLPILQSPSSEARMVVRFTGNPEKIPMLIKNKLHDIDSGLPLFIQTWKQGLRFQLFPAGVATVSLGILGLIGAMLSLTGIFGMAAYSVSKRLRELGIRRALGAQPYAVLQTALGRAIKLLAYGSIAGIILGLLATRILASIVYQATPRDPLVLASVVVAMAFIGLLAAWFPAHRALSVEPLILLREE